MAEADRRVERRVTARARSYLVGSTVALGIAILAPTHVARADDDAGPVDASSDVGVVDAPDDVVVEAAGPATSGDASKLDAAADALAYDAGSGLTPLEDLPTWGEGEDHNGCSCRLANGPRNAAATALPSSLAMLAWMRSRRRRR